MKAVNLVLVKVDKTYNNEVELSNGLNLVVNTTIESVANVNRIAEVIAAPSGTVLKKGDSIIVHHNIFRKKNSTSGEEVESDYYIEKGIYFVPPTEVFAYKRGTQWKALDPFVFVSPVLRSEEDRLSKLIEVVDHDKYKPNVGKIRFINKELSEWGLVENDLIYFSDDSEYEFNIEGELLYRMRTNDILGRYECQD